MGMTPRYKIRMIEEFLSTYPDVIYIQVYREMTRENDPTVIMK